MQEKTIIFLYCFANFSPQIKWLNAYNKQIRKVIGPYLGSSTTTARKWLDKRTQEITYKFSVSGAETTVSMATTFMVSVLSVILCRLFANI